MLFTCWGASLYAFILYHNFLAGLYVVFIHIMAVGCSKPSSLISFTFIRVSACLVLYNQLKCANTATELIETPNTALHYGTVPKVTSTGETARKHGRGKTYLASRTLHSTKGTSFFQLRRIALSGDIQINPGPVGKRVPKYPCKECNKNVRNNQDALLCAVCNSWSHAKQPWYG